MKTCEIHMRDPYVLPWQGRYILLGTTDDNCWSGKAQGFRAYTSADLENWTPAGWLFRRTPDFWGEENFWAPELHVYKGGFFLLASFKAPNRRRATCILRADDPLGPFTPWGDVQLTPRDWECLDGTLFVDDRQRPWLVFCHEWLQTGDGEMCAVALRDDLTGPAGDPILLFRASEAPWAVETGDGPRGFVTDGPFLYRSRRGGLWMLWSSQGRDGYAIGVAQSGGGLTGPWRQEREPFFGRDGGHGMIFRTLDGRLMLSIHAPNQTPNERPLFLPIEESGNAFRRIDENGAALF